MNASGERPDRTAEHATSTTVSQVVAAVERIRDELAVVGRALDAYVARLESVDRDDAPPRR